MGGRGFWEAECWRDWCLLPDERADEEAGRDLGETGAEGGDFFGEEKDDEKGLVKVGVEERLGKR